MIAGTEATNRRVDLSLVIPAYDEVESIGRAILDANAALRAFAADYEIIVVSDGSTDGTAELVRRATVINPRVRLMEHECNRGYGAALRSGLSVARFPLVAITDADCQFDLHQLADLVRAAERHDVVCGYRIDRQDPAYRRFLSWGYNKAVTLLLGGSVRDCDCAMKVFRREVLPRVMPESDNFFANAEMVWKARQHGLSIAELEVRHRPRRLGRSKVTFRDVPRTLATLLPFWWSRRLFPRSAG